MEYPAKAIKYTKNEYLLEANKLADKYNLSGLSVMKLAAWAFLESSIGVWNNNPGNIRNRSNDDFFYNPGPVNEYINGKLVVASDKKDPIRKFKHFQTLTDGIEGMLQWVIKNHPGAFSALTDDGKTGYDFAFELGKPDNRGYHYYTDKPDHYAPGVERCFQAMLKL
jgi:hypothetical protein